MKKLFMKKRILFPLIYMGEIIIFYILRKLLGIELNFEVGNILYTCIYFAVIVCTPIIFFMILINKYKANYPAIKILYFPILILIMNLFLLPILIISSR